MIRGTFNFYRSLFKTGNWIHRPDAFGIPAIISMFVLGTIGLLTKSVVIFAMTCVPAIIITCLGTVAIGRLRTESDKLKKFLDEESKNQ